MYGYIEKDNIYIHFLKPHFYCFACSIRSRIMGSTV